MQAAQNLIKELQRDYMRLIEGKQSLEEVFSRWHELMKMLRQVEKKCMILREPSDHDLQQHRKAVSLMIFCSGLIISTGEAHLMNNYHLDIREADALKAEIERMKGHRKILKLESTGWHGPIPRSALADEMGRMFGVSGRKAA